MTTIGDDYPKEQARIRQCRQDGLEIGPAGAFCVAMADDLLRRADEAAISGDIVKIVQLYKEMREFES